MTELDAIRSAKTYSTVIGTMVTALVALGSFNRVRARSAVLYFEDIPPEIVTRLGLMYIPSSPSASPEVSHR